MPENVGRTTIKTERAGKLSRIAHFQRLEVARKQPGNCRRCGKPNGNGLSQCDRCRAYQKNYKLGLRNMRFTAPTEIMKVIHQFRRELSHLRSTVKTMASGRRTSYLRGYRMGLAGKRARFIRGVWMPPEMSKQELATINHAYAGMDEL